MKILENEARVEDVSVQLEKYEPTLRILFNSHEEMWVFYKAYDKQEEFFVKKLTSKKGSDGNVKYPTLAYNRNSKSESKSTNMLKPIVKTMILKLGIV